MIMFLLLPLNVFGWLEQETPYLSHNQVDQ